MCRHPSKPCQKQAKNGIFAVISAIYNMLKNFWQMAKVNYLQILPAKHK
jgi:hypothetical protein